MGNPYGSKGYVGGTLSCSLTLLGAGILAFVLSGIYNSIAVIIGGIGCLIVSIGAFISFLQYAEYGNGSSHSKIVGSSNKGRVANPTAYDRLRLASTICLIVGSIVIIAAIIVGCSNMNR